MRIFVCVLIVINNLILPLIISRNFIADLTALLKNNYIRILIPPFTRYIYLCFIKTCTEIKSPERLKFYKNKTSLEILQRLIKSTAKPTRLKKKVHANFRLQLC